MKVVECITFFRSTIYKAKWKDELQSDRVLNNLNEKRYCLEFVLMVHNYYIKSVIVIPRVVMK